MVGGLMYLVDTNVWLEVLLEQEKASESQDFLLNADAEDLAITEFSVYSIGVVVGRLKKMGLFRSFIVDTIENAGIRRIRLALEDLVRIPDVMEEEKLDFDDAYQYVAAERHGLSIVSFDGDFDHTRHGRMTPLQTMENL
jgi:uncharacterized protein